MPQMMAETAALEPGVVVALGHLLADDGLSTPVALN
jgi:hypothetical protein